MDGSLTAAAVLGNDEPDCWLDALGLELVCDGVDVVLRDRGGARHSSSLSFRINVMLRMKRYETLNIKKNRRGRAAIVQARVFFAFSLPVAANMIDGRRGDALQVGHRSDLGGTLRTLER